MQKQCGISLIDKVVEVKNIHDNYKNSLIKGIDESLAFHQICFENIEDYISKYHYFFNHGILNKDGKIMVLNRFFSLNFLMPDMKAAKKIWDSYFEIN